MENNLTKGLLIKCQVKITFSELTDEQREYFFKAEEYLGKAGIQFDRGGFAGCHGGARDWEFDYSLSPNVTVWLYPEKQTN